MLFSLVLYVRLTPVGDLGAAHQALLQRGGPTGFQPYVRPSLFPARIVGLLICVCASLVMASLVALTVPVWLGRKIMSIWPVMTPVQGKELSDVQIQ